MIELKDFVSETLKQIVSGIKEAQPYIKENGGTVNPKNLVEKQGKSASIRYTRASSHVIGQAFYIDFDIAIVTKDSSTKDGGVGIFISPITIGGKAGKEQSISNTSRINFSVPVEFPYSE